jgi:hypothetical protein
MSEQKRIWRLLVPIAILALVIGTTLGVVWHHDANPSSSDTCPMCHLGHLAVEPSVAAVQVHVLVPTGAGPEPQHVSVTVSFSSRHLPSRAPPA